MKFKEALLYLLVFLLPTQLGKHFFFPFSIINGVRIDYLAPTLYLTDILIFFLFFFYLSDIKIHWNKRIFIILSLLVLNVIVALSPWVSLYKGFKYAEIILLFFIISKSKLTSKFLLITIVLSTLLQFFVAISQILNEHAMQGIMYFFGERYFTISTPGIAKVVLQGKEILRAYGTFSHPNSLAGFYLLLYTFLLFEKRFNKYITLKYCILGLSSVLIFLSFSKISIIVFLFMNGIYLLKNSTCKFCTIGKIISLLILSAVFISARGDSESTNKRISLLQDSIKIISSYPFLGVGLGNYVIAQSNFPMIYSYYFLQPVHNIVLLFLAEVGIPLSLFVGYYISGFIKTIIQKEKQISIVLLVVIGITGFFDHYWLTLQQNMLLFPLVFGLLKNKKWH